MKKFLVATVAALSMVGAYALDVGVSATNARIVDSGANQVGVNVGQNFGGLRTYVSYERTLSTSVAQNRYSVGTSYDLLKVSAFAVAPGVEGSWLQNRGQDSGYAVTPFVRASYDLNKNNVVYLQYGHQFGQSKVNQFNANRFTVGYNYKF